MSGRSKRERKPVDYTGVAVEIAKPVAAPAKKGKSKKVKEVTPAPVEEVASKSHENGQNGDNDSNPSLSLQVEKNIVEKKPASSTTSKKRGKRTTSDDGEVASKSKSKASSKDVSENQEESQPVEKSKSRKKKAESDENGTSNGVESKKSSKKRTASKESAQEEEEGEISEKKSKAEEKEPKTKKGSRKRSKDEAPADEEVVDQPAKKRGGKRVTPDKEVKTKTKSKAEVKEMPEVEHEKLAEKPRSRGKRGASTEVEANGEGSKPTSSTKASKKKIVADETNEEEEAPTAKKAKTKAKTTEKESKSKKTSRNKTKDNDSNGDLQDKESAVDLEPIPELPEAENGEDAPRAKKSGKSAKKKNSEVQEEAQNSNKDKDESPIDLEPAKEVPEEETEAAPKAKKGRAAKKQKPVDNQKLSEEEPKPKKGRETKKRVADEEVLEDEPTEAEAPKTKDSKPKMNATVTNYEDIDFSLDKEFSTKISSWNVAGLRSWLTKEGLKYIEHEKPDILCLQETKCEMDKLPDESRINGYHPYWLCHKGGYAGVAIYSKKMPINVEYGIGDKEQDEDGRIITAEYERFFLVCTYVPNSGRGLVTLEKRLRWNTIFKDYIAKLNAIKPVIIAGDMNVAHEEIDLARPQTNKKSAGFTKEERDGMTEFLATGFVDVFRHFYKDKEGAYTYWTYMANARSKNVGWRLDYFLVSERIVDKMVDNVIRNQVLGSDHCPITLFANI